MSFLSSHPWVLPLAVAFSWWLLAVSILWVRPKELDEEGNIVLRYIGTKYLSIVLFMIFFFFGVFQWWTLNRDDLVNLVIFAYIPIVISMVPMYLIFYFWSFRITLCLNVIRLHNFARKDIDYKLNDLVSIIKENRKYILFFGDGQQLRIYENMSGAKFFITHLHKFLNSKRKVKRE